MVIEAVWSPRAPHVERCDARYRSYDHRTDTFVGYDCDEHYCQL